MPARSHQWHLKLEPWQHERLQQLPAGAASAKIRQFITEGFAREDMQKEAAMITTTHAAETFEAALARAIRFRHQWQTPVSIYICYAGPRENPSEMWFVACAQTVFPTKNHGSELLLELDTDTLNEYAEWGEADAAGFAAEMESVLTEAIRNRRAN